MIVTALAYGSYGRLTFLILVAVGFLPAACATMQQSSQSPAQFAFERTRHNADVAALAHIPFADIRRISADEIISAYGMPQLRRWINQGDPIAAYVLANHALGVDLAEDLPSVIIDDAAFNLYRKAAKPTCIASMPDEIRLFAGCDTGLPEAQYAIGLYCERHVATTETCRDGARAWFEKSARNGFYFAAGKL